MTDDLISTLRAVVGRLDRANIPYMIVGSVAALAHGRSRATQHFDLVIEADSSRLRALLSSLPEERFYASLEASLDALRRQTLFNIIDMETGWKIDFVPRKTREFSRVEFSRRREIDLFGLSVFVASLEDIVVAKLEWSKFGGGSARQREDVRELVRMAGDRLDLTYVRTWIEQLGLEAEWAEATGAA